MSIGRNWIVILPAVDIFFKFKSNKIVLVNKCVIMCFDEVMYNI